MPDSIPIVDTHLHLWDLERFCLPWVHGNAKLDRSFVMDDYFEATTGLNVTKTVYMEVDLDPTQQVQEAEYVIDLCSRGDNPMSGAVISGRPGTAVFRPYISGMAQSPYIKGVRQVLHGSAPRGYCLQPEFIRDIRLLGDLGLSFDLCMRSAELSDAVALVGACPDTRFILDHCGNMSVQASDRSQWERDLSELAARSNVICKVSGIVASAQPGDWTANDLAPIVNRVLDTFGPDRVVFGGDWPVCTLTATFHQWVEALKTIVRSRSHAEQRKLFHDNAAHFYGLQD